MDREQAPAGRGPARCQATSNRRGNSGQRVRPKVTIGVVLAGVAVAAAAGCSSASTKTAAGPTVTATESLPGPTQTVTVTASPVPPPAGTAIGTWSGNGTSVTPPFNAPASGNYILSWTYSGNNQSGSGDNFIINTTDQGATTESLPNDIQTSGSGSTEITGASGVERFNVQADSTCNWTIKAVSA